MARLYEYAESNKKIGYFLRGGTSSSNYTMRATSLGKRLFDQLDYNPGIVNKERGPRIPSQLQWAMYNVGLLETSGNEPSGSGFDGELDVEDAEITDGMIAELKEFVLSESTDRVEIQELADILNIDLERSSENYIWELSDSQGREVADIFETKIEKVICTKDAPNWDITVRHTPEIPGREGTTTFHVDIEHPVDENEIYTHQMYYVSNEIPDNSGLATMTKAPVDQSRRVRIDRQRGRVLEAMSHVPQLLGERIGDSAEDITCITVEEVLD